MALRIAVLVSLLTAAGCGSRTPLDLRETEVALDAAAPVGTLARRCPPGAPASTVVPGARFFTHDRDALYAYVHDGDPADAIWRIDKRSGARTLLARDVVSSTLVLGPRTLHWMTYLDDALLAVRGMPREGGSPATLATLMHSSQSGRIATDAEYVYVGLLDAGEVVAVPIAGGDSIVIAEYQAYPSVFASSGGHVYAWSAQRLWRFDVADRSSHKLPIYLPDGAALDGDVLFVTSGETQVARLSMLAPGQVDPTVLVRDLVYPQDVALDAASVYWIELGADFDPQADVQKPSAVVRKVARAGGAPVTVAIGERAPNALAVDDECVLWIASDDQGRVGLRQIAK